MDLCGTPAFTGNNSDSWLFNATLLNLFSKKHGENIDYLISQVNKKKIKW